jgi:hypothetical protein
MAGSSLCRENFQKAPHCDSSGQGRIVPGLLVFYVFTFSCQVPRQPNFSDCGVYVLHFVRVFLSNPVLLTKHFQVMSNFTPIWDHVHVTPQQPQEDTDLWEVWQMHNLSTLRQDFLSYIKATELAAER